MKKKEATKVIRLLRDGLNGLHIAHDMELSAYEVCMIEEAWKEVDSIEKKERRLRSEGTLPNDRKILAIEGCKYARSCRNPRNIWKHCAFMGT